MSIWNVWVLWFCGCSVVVVVWLLCCCGVFGIKDCSTNCLTRSWDQRVANLGCGRGGGGFLFVKDWLTQRVIGSYWPQRLKKLECWCWWLCCCGLPVVVVVHCFRDAGFLNLDYKAQHSQWKRKCPKHAKETYILCTIHAMWIKFPRT